MKRVASYKKRVVRKEHCRDAAIISVRVTHDMAQETQITVVTAAVGNQIFPYSFSMHYFFKFMQ